MSDHIEIQGLWVETHIGVPDEERQKPQWLRISVSLKTDSLAPAARSDDLQKTVDYFTVSEEIRKLAQAKPRRLIETLAEEIASTVLTREQVLEVTVAVDKFILKDTDSVSVRIERHR